MKTAIVYDRVNKWGGAERVLLALHEIFPAAPLYTSVYNKKGASWARVFPEIIPSFLQKIPLLRNNHELFGWLTPLAYEAFSFDNYDLVISVTSEAAKGIITKSGTVHICYCLTPTRYLWSGYREYLNNPPKSLSWIPFYKRLSKPFLKYTKYWDKIAANRPDVILGISRAVQERIKRYYGRDTELIYPPVDIEKCKASKVSKVPQVSKEYYLIVSRLVPYKKVDLALNAFSELELPLVVVGTGSEEGKYKSKYKSKKNIIFKGFVTEHELAQIYKNAKALVHPQDEDFGITAVEAQAVGVPVIAYNKGGALDTVVEGKTGIFFKKQDVKSLVIAVRSFDKLDSKKLKAQDCIENAKKFSKERFQGEFKKLVEKHTGSQI